MMFFDFNPVNMPIMPPTFNCLPASRAPFGIIKQRRKARKLRNRKRSRR